MCVSERCKTERQIEREREISCEDQIILLTCDYAAAPKNNVRKKWNYRGLIEWQEIGGPRVGSCHAMKTTFKKKKVQETIL